MNTNQMRWALARFLREESVTCVEGGLVPLLDVREKCGCCQYPEDPCECFNIGEVEKDGDCAPCHGLGYVPTENFAKWMEAAFGKGYAIMLSDYEYPRDGVQETFSARLFYDAEEVAWEEGFTIEEALVSALYQACLPLAVNPEVVEWVKEHIK